MTFCYVAFGSSRFAAIQVEYNLIQRTDERELIPVPKALNLGVTE
jgi:aryl-alcohol dehydrogenase-like predicted oxidoreductase